VTAAILRQICDAVFNGFRRMINGDRGTPKMYLTRIGCDKAKDRFGKLCPSGPDKPGNADDLARANR